ncbi:energy transducer TonB [bacterium]|nr:energy transducer TonB [bacterium]
MAQKTATIREHATERMQMGVIGSLGIVVTLFLVLGNMGIKPMEIKRVSSDPVKWNGTLMDETKYTPPPINSKVVEVTKATSDDKADTTLPGQTNFNDITLIGNDRLKRTFDDVNIPPVNAVKPQLVGKMDVRYPERMRRLEAEGLVIVGAALDEEGLVFDTRILKGSGFAELDSAAVDAVRKARFTPAMQGDKALAVKISVPVKFKLTD